MQEKYRDSQVESIVCTYYFSWTPIVIGAFIAIGLSFLLDLFGKGIGLSLYTNDSSGALVLAVGGFVALLFAGFISMFAAGFAAGFFAGPTCGKRRYGAVYGLVAWCLSLILAGFLASNLVVSDYMKHDRTSTPTTREVSSTAENVTTRLHPATDARDTQAERQVRAAGMLSLATFFIFFVGALGASFGGYVGLSYWDRWDEDYRRRNV